MSNVLLVALLRCTNSRVNIWKKKPLTPKKLQQKVSQLILLGFGVPFNILKV